MMKYLMAILCLVSTVCQADTVSVNGSVSLYAVTDAPYSLQDLLNGGLPATLPVNFKIKRNRKAWAFRSKSATGSCRPFGFKSIVCDASVVTPEACRVDISYFMEPVSKRSNRVYLARFQRTFCGERYEGEIESRGLGTYRITR